MPDNWIDKGTIQKASKSDKFFNWLRHNRDTAVGSFVLIIALVILGSYFSVRYSQIKQSAWEELFKARQMAYSGNIDASNKTIEKIAGSFAKTSAYPHALLLKGDILYRQGKYGEAVKEYKKVVADEKTEYLSPIALYGIGKSEEAGKNPEKAKKSYEKFLKMYPEHFLAPEVHLSLARIYGQLNETDKAKSAYEKIAVLYPQTYWAQIAMARLNPKPEK